VADFPFSAFRLSFSFAAITAGRRSENDEWKRTGAQLKIDKPQNSHLTVYMFVAIRVHS
jgi:hypothetical protein